MMNEQRCLYCYLPLETGDTDFHEKCCRRFFGTPTPPVFDHTNDEMQQLAADIVLRSITITGVQPKLSLTLKTDPADPKKSRFTIVGLWGQYILKPPTDLCPHLPENEDLTMHLAQLYKIKTAEHSLLRLKSGELAYITKRFDRQGDEKVAVEDMCQLTGTLTEDKYHSSMERIGKKIREFSSVPGLDTVNFFEQVLLCFVTGNADMHLKNFSLLTNQARITVLSPAYDLLCTRLANPADKEESALTINAKKNKIKKSDFDQLGQHLKLHPRVITHSLARLNAWRGKANELIGRSFLPGDVKTAYIDLIHTNLARLNA